MNWAGALERVGTLVGSGRLDGAGSLLLVGTGGFAGAVLRHAAAVSLPTAVLGTLAVNVLGSFALGAVLAGSPPTRALSAEARLLVGTGFLSSFTTYSAFAVETASLSPRAAAANVAANYALGFLAVVAGQALARWAS